MGQARSAAVSSQADASGGGRDWLGLDAVEAAVRQSVLQATVEPLHGPRSQACLDRVSQVALLHGTGQHPPA